MKSMVAERLTYLLGKVDMSNITQILDIGSWHLRQSIEFLTIFDSAFINAFEPVPSSYDLCRKHHAALNISRQDRIRIHNIALSNTVGEIPFFEVDKDLSSTPNVGASSMLPFMDGLNGTLFGQTLIQKKIMVQANTLDNWCGENNLSHVDIMWIDVQGAELFVFQGARDILSRTKVIMTEVGLKPYYQGHTLKPEIDKLLIDIGFVELENAFKLNGFDSEADTIYVRKDLMS